MSTIYCPGWGYFEGWGPEGLPVVTTDKGQALPLEDPDEVVRELDARIRPMGRCWQVEERA